MARRPARALPRVTSSACSRSAPTGRPLASRVTSRESGSRSAIWRAVASPVVVGLVARTISRTSSESPTRRDQLGDPQVLRVDPVDRREGAAEDVVEAAVLVGPLDRDHVTGLLDHADHRGVAGRVLADPAARPLREVEADLAEADLLLHLADRVGEAGGLLVVGSQDVEGEPLRGPLPDPRQAGQLGDQAA